MRKLLTLLLSLTAVGALAAPTGVKGRLIDAQSGQPVADADVMLRDQGLSVTSGSDGFFQITNASSGTDVLEIMAFGFDDKYVDIDLTRDIVRNIGDIRLSVSGFGGEDLNSDNFIFDDERIADDESAQQSVGTIQGATDDIFYQAASYQYSVMRYRMRGLPSSWQAGYINGVKYNDAMRGMFNYSGLGGMTSSAFRNKTTDIGMAPSSYGFGGIGGAQNFTTYASQYAPGFRGNLSYTNSNYMLRAMLQYNTGLNKHGWAFSASIIGRYAPQGVIKGTYYNSIGYALSLQKVFNDRHSLNLTTWGAPTERAGNNAATQEAYDLAGSNLYNPDWGYLNEKKHSDRVYKTFDPSVMLNWIWKPKMGTRLNTGLAFRSNNYSSSALNWYQAADPRPDYYRKLPSYFKPSVTEEENPELYAQQVALQQYVADWWGGDKHHRQIDWNSLYQANLLNRTQFDRDPELVGQSTYILENRHSNFNAYMLNSTLDHRLSDILTMQGGLSVNFTDAHYYKTIRNLLGGEFWRDIDNFSERDFAGDVNIMQNDLDNPDRKVRKGDKFGYDYYIRDINGRLWLQNQIVTRHWNVDYAAEFSVTSFWRHGMMRNGRAPGGVDENGRELPMSKGKGETHTFANFGVKAGATY